MPLISSLGVMNALGFGLSNAVITVPYLAVSHVTSPYVSAYPWANGFGAKYNDPASLPPAQGSALCISSDGKILAVPQGYLPDTKEAIEKYKKEYSQYWNGVLSGDGDITFSEKEETEENEEEIVIFE